MERKASQSKVICASDMFLLYALPICDSMEPLKILQTLNTEMRCGYAD